MKLRNSRHGRDALAAQLSQLLPLGGINVDEAVHVADAESLHAVRGMELPLCAEATLFFVSVQRNGKRSWEVGFLCRVCRKGEERRGVWNGKVDKMSDTY